MLSIYRIHSYAKETLTYYKRNLVHLEYDINLKFQSFGWNFNMWNVLSGMQEEWSVLIAALNHTLCHTVYLSKLSQNPFCTLVFMKIRMDVSQSVWHGIIYKYISPIRQFGSRFTAADSHICNGWLCCSSYVPYYYE